MIFEANKKAELLIEAAKYRLSYSNLRESNDIIRKRAQGYVINLDFSNYFFYSPRSNEFFTISSFNDSIKQNIFSIYFFNTLLSEYKKSFSSLVDKLKSFNSKLELDIKYLNSVLEKQKIKTAGNYSKVFLIENFKDSNTENAFHLKDFKTNISLSKENIIDSSYETLNINKTKEEALIPEFVSLIYEETNFGDNSEPLIFNDIENILEEKEPFRFVIFKKIEDSNGYKYDIEKVKLTVLFDFNKKVKINNLKIKYACSKPITIEKNALKFFNRKTNSWESLLFSDTLNNNDSDLFFETIITDKIKITFSQYQHLEEKEMNSFVGKIYDLSIDCVLFNFSIFKNMSIYRSADYLILNQPLSLNYDVNYIYEDKDVFVEKYLNINLFGEASFDAYKKKTLLKDDLKRESSRYNSVIPVPTNSIVQKELLIFSFGTAKIQFVPKEKTIKIFKNNQTESLVYGSDYVISRNKKSSFLNEEELLDDINLDERYCGNWYVKLLDNGNSVTNQFLNSYRIEYEISPLFFFDKSIACYNNKIVFNLSVQDSIGFLKPYLILRTKKNNNDSSSIINKLLIKCEEKEEKENDVQLEEFIELIAKEK